MQYPCREHRPAAAVRQRVSPVLPGLSADCRWALSGFLTFVTIVWRAAV
jgi:hypothetical protein